MSTSLGQKLAALRAGRRLTLRQVAAQTGLAESFLSKLEHDRVNISVSNLRKLARVYAVAMAQFFEHEDDRPPSTVIRQAERRRLVEPGGDGQLEILSPPHHANLQAVLRLIPAGAGGETEPDRGEALCVVMRGRLRFEVAGQAHDLAEGDTIHYRRNVPHGWRNAGDVEAVVLTVYAPPLL